jgi:integrase
LLPAQLTAEHLQSIVGAWRKQFAQHTRSTYTKCLRRFVRWLERIAGAQPTLSDAVPRIHQPEPRATIATDGERHMLLEAATPALRFFLLLCADLGLRHRTAARIALSNYNPHLRALSFTTKGNVRQTLPVTGEIAAIIEALPQNSDRYAPIVNLLRPHRPGHVPGSSPRFTKQWKALKRRTNTRPELRIHDLRRTLAEDVWTATHDLRAVQAQLGHRSPTTTARYLADRIGLQDLQPVMHKVQQLRAREAAHPQQTQAPLRCESCPISNFCNPTARLCERKEHDA